MFWAAIRGAIGGTLGLVLASACAAQSPGPPAEPFLRVEAGTHTASINDLVLLPDGRLVTASDDQTVRLWDAQTGASRGVVRGPAGPRDEGAIYALATDGKYLVTGGRAGWTWGSKKPFLRFLAVSDLRPLGVLSGLSTPIGALTFDPTGQYLAVGLYGPEAGLRVFRLGQGSPVLIDRAYPAGLTDLAYLGPTRIAATGGDGRIRIYEVDTGRVDHLTGVPDSRPWRIAANPAGPGLAVGLRERAAVGLYGTPGSKPQLLRAPGLQTDGFPVVAWSPDGRSIFAVGRAASTTRDWAIHRWSADGRYQGAWVTDTVLPTALAGAADGGVFVGDAGGGLRRIGPDGRSRYLKRPNAPNLRSAAIYPLDLSENGASISFPLDTDGARATFDVRDRNLRPASSSARRPAFADPRVSAIDNGRRLMIDGRAITLAAGERALAAAVGPKGQVFVTSNFYVRAYGDGQLVWRQPLASAGWGVAVSERGEHLVVARGDGIIQWRSPVDGTVKLSLFATRDLADWVLWTPAGFFDHSPARQGGRGGADLIGYHLNNGHGAAEFLPIERFYRRYYRSDVVSAAFRGEDSDREIVANAVDALDDAAVQARDVRAPALRISEVCGIDMHGAAAGCVRPDAAAAIRGTLPVLDAAERPPQSVELILSITDRGSGLSRVDIRRNGASVAFEYAGHLKTSDEQVVLRQRVELVPGENVISVRAFDESGDVASAKQTVRLRGAADQPDRRGVYVLSVGVGDYDAAEGQLDLATADNDAREIARAFRDAGQRGVMFDRSDVVELTNTDATQENIVNAIRAIAERAEPSDTVVIFLGGHGNVIDGNYYFAPHDLATGQDDLIDDVRRGLVFDDVALRKLFRARGLSQDELMSEIARISAERVIIILDTCYAGGFSGMTTAQRDDVTATVAQRVSRETGRFVVGSARGLANDYDGKDYPAGMGHGLFTSALLEAIEGQADTNQNEEISLVEAGQYLKVRVPAVAKQKQLDAPQQTPVASFLGDPFFPLIDVASRE